MRQNDRLHSSLFAFPPFNICLIGYANNRTDTSLYTVANHIAHCGKIQSFDFCQQSVASWKQQLHPAAPCYAGI